MPTAAAVSTSEIDDIFGSSSGSKATRKGVDSTAVPAAISTSASTLSNSKKEKKTRATNTVITNVLSDPTSQTALASAAEERRSKKTKHKKKRLTGSEEVRGDDTGSDPSPSIQPEALGATSILFPKKKRPALETVLDPSARIESKGSSLPFSKKRRIEHHDGNAGSGTRSGGVPYIRYDARDDERFRDSRGTGPSTLRYLSCLSLNRDQLLPTFHFRAYDRRRLFNIQGG